MRQSGAETRAASMSSTRSSGTSSPRSMKLLACRPRGVPRALLSRKRMPVETCGRERAWLRRTACVPLPAPGAPSRTTIRAISALAGPACAAESTDAARALALDEALVVAHHELRVQAVDQVHGHAHDDEHRGAAEEVGQPARESGDAAGD